MNTKKSYNFETLDQDIKNLIGEELYNKCKNLRNTSDSKYGYQYTRFIRQKGNKVTYHFTRTACEKVYNDIHLYNRDSQLANAYSRVDGYKITFNL